jgi:hypothetical protein
MEDVIIYWVGAVLLVGLGLLGLVLPGLPGAPLILIGLILGAWADNFTHVGLRTIIVLAVLAGLTYAVDFLGDDFWRQEVRRIQTRNHRRSDRRRRRSISRPFRRHLWPFYRRRDW